MADVKTKQPRVLKAEKQAATDRDAEFAVMLAEMDSRIDEITARTDRLLAQHS